MPPAYSRSTTVNTGGIADGRRWKGRGAAHRRASRAPDDGPAPRQPHVFVVGLRRADVSPRGHLFCGLPEPFRSSASAGSRTLPFDRRTHGDDGRCRCCHLAERCAGIAHRGAGRLALLAIRPAPGDAPARSRGRCRPVGTGKRVGVLSNDRTSIAIKTNASSSSVSNSIIRSNVRVSLSLDALRRNPSGVRYRCKLCDEHFGEPRQRGTSHRVYRTHCHGGTPMGSDSDQGRLFHGRRVGPGHGRSRRRRPWGMARGPASEHPE